MIEAMIAFSLAMIMEYAAGVLLIALLRLPEMKGFPLISRLR
jgi:hypothetical protein